MMKRSSNNILTGPALSRDQDISRRISDLLNQLERCSKPRAPPDEFAKRKPIRQLPFEGAILIRQTLSTSAHFTEQERVLDPDGYTVGDKCKNPLVTRFKCTGY